MESVNSLSEEIINNKNGTDSMPLYVNCVIGKCGKGNVFFIKIGENFFQMVKRGLDKNGCLVLRCKFYRPPQSC